MSGTVGAAVSCVYPNLPGKLSLFQECHLTSASLRCCPTAYEDCGRCYGSVRQSQVTGGAVSRGHWPGCHYETGLFAEPAGDATSSCLSGRAYHAHSNGRPERTSRTLLLVSSAYEYVADSYLVAHRAAACAQHDIAPLYAASFLFNFVWRLLRRSAALRSFSSVLLRKPIRTRSCCQPNMSSYDYKRDCWLVYIGRAVLSPRIVATRIN